MECVDALYQMSRIQRVTSYYRGPHHKLLFIVVGKSRIWNPAGPSVQRSLTMINAQSMLVGSIEKRVGRPKSWALFRSWLGYLIFNRLAQEESLVYCR